MYTYIHVTILSRVYIHAEVLVNTRKRTNRFWEQGLFTITLTDRDILVHTFTLIERWLMYMYMYMYVHVANMYPVSWDSSQPSINNILLTVKHTTQAVRLGIKLTMKDFIGDFCLSSTLNTTKHGHCSSSLRKCF